MSFYTSLTGLNAATAQLGVTSNNIANVSTTGFKRSRTDFGDIFATSPLQKASATIGQGVSLKRVVQEFGQGNMVFSSNTLDLAISGDGFFPLKSQDGFQDIFTRNGVFMMNDQYNVVNSAGQKLMAASVDSSGKANLDDMNVLTIPQKTTGMAKQTSKVQLGLNFPADASVITKDFNRNDPESYNKSTALTVYDAGGNSYLASVYYVKTQNASQGSPNNKWQTYVYVGDKLVSASLQQATNSVGDVMYVNKYGELRAKSDFKTPAEIAELNSSFSKKTIKFSLDDLTDVRTSQPATITAGLATDLGTGSNDGIDFGKYVEVSKSDLLRQQGSSAAIFSAFDATTTGNTIVTVAGLTDPITIPPNGSQSASIDQVAAALNKDAGFANVYVAQSAHTVASVTGVQFAPGAASASFVTATVKVGGQTITIKPLTSLNLADLATEIEDGLNQNDLENNQVAPAGYFTVEEDNGVLVVTDTMRRNIESVELTPATNYAALAKSGTTNFSGHVLRVTAIDPNVQGVDITGTQATPKLQIKQGTATAMQGVASETHYSRAYVKYTFDGGAEGYRAEFNNKFFEAATSSDLADLLNKDTSFAALYIAEASATDELQVKSRDPSMADPQKINAAIVVAQSTESATGPFTELVEPDPANPTVIVLTQGEPSIKASELKSVDDLKDLFSINVDNSIESVSVGLSHLLDSMKALPSTASKKLSGTQIAAELTSVLNRAYGDEKPFDFTTVGKPTFSIELVDKNKQSIGKLDIDLSPFNSMRYEDLVTEVQTQINASSKYSDKVVVSYDTQAQKLVFSPTDNAKVTVSSVNSAMNLSEPLVQGVNDQSVGFAITPSVSTSSFRATNDQRYGMKVEYDAVKQGFVFKSGTTGDGSSIVISNIRPGSLATQTSKGLGLTGDTANYSVSPSTIDALRGITSKPAVLTGNAVAVNVDNNFSVDATNNQFVVSVNGITGTVVVPPKDTYTLGTFMEALQNGINNLQGPIKNGLTPDTVNGVKVSFDATKKCIGIHIRNCI